ncbi:tetratricopeptide repeat protein [Desulfuromonas sp.]|uniref:tetratricopeptide repeat protein n=1 Tax=Desulfuromonas sp. TaxID=892 RepID=UPI0025C3944B|nr:tetratricopeptide repeat protein [Desulfuromonas sp.]
MKAHLLLIAGVLALLAGPAAADPWKVQRQDGSELQVEIENNDGFFAGRVNKTFTAAGGVLIGEVQAIEFSRFDDSCFESPCSGRAHGRIIMRDQTSAEFDTLCTQSFVFSSPFGQLVLQTRSIRALSRDGLGLEKIEQRASAGDPDAQFQLGQAYYEGKVLLRDPTEAARWYEKAANSGHSEAQYRLGLLYSRGDGVVESYAQAAKWLFRAARQDHPEAQCRFGAMLFEGKGTSKDSIKGYAWTVLAAAQNATDARDNLARMKGQMTPPQLEAAQQIATILCTPESSALTGGR